MKNLLSGKVILITGGTGSLGSALVKRITTGEWGQPKLVIIYSRDELKQAEMCCEFAGINYMKYVIGDVRNYQSLYNAVLDADIVIHSAAMKRVDTCEEYPDEAVLTNYMGASNLVNAIQEGKCKVKCVVGISSDKGAKPLNVYGMTKALQEKRLLRANYEYPCTRFVCVRYGNVMGSRGSVIPVWQAQIAKGLPINVTNPDMTRFLLSLHQAVDTIIAVIKTAKAGDIYIPHSLPAVRIGDLAKVMLKGDESRIVYTGRGYGEKMVETLITDEEAETTIIRGKYYVVTTNRQKHPAISKEYISSDYLITPEKLRDILIENGVIDAENK